ncbi:MAG TPA: hypothetical protein VF550_22105 [Polyangia bacterium]
MPNFQTFQKGLILNIVAVAVLSFAACGDETQTGGRTDTGVLARADGAADASGGGDGLPEAGGGAHDTAGVDDAMDVATNVAVDTAAAVDVATGEARVDSAAIGVATDVAVDDAASVEIATSTGGEDARGTIDLGGADQGVTCPSSAGGATDGGATIPVAAPDKVTFYPNVTVSTFAGGAADTDFTNPVGVAIEPGGTLIVSDYDQNRLIRVSASGGASVLTLQSSFQYPFALAYDNVRNILYATTDANSQGRKDSAQMSSTVWTINAGSGAASNLSVATAIGYTRGLGVLSDGRVVASDRTNHLIWLIDPVTGTKSMAAGSPSCIGGVDGAGAGASFNDPYGLAVLPDDSIVVADYGLRILRRISKTGVVTGFAGDGGPAGTIDGPAASARFARPQAVAADGNGVVYVSDTQAHRIRRIAPDGTVTTLAGAGTQGFMDGAGSTAQFYAGEGLAVSSDGRTVYIADGTGGSEVAVPYHRIRKITIGP